MGKLYLVQVVNGESYKKKATQQYTKSPYSVFDRGSIFFTNKKGEAIAAASVKTGYLLSINPSIIKNPNDVYSKITAFIPIDKEKFHTSVSKKSDTYEELAYKIDEETAEEIKSKKIEGVFVHKHSWRYYPGKSLASSVIGFVSFHTKNYLTGTYGIERHFDHVLGRNESDLYTNFFAEAFSNISGIISSEKDGRDGDVYMTIEPTVQQNLEKVLMEIKNKWASEFAAGIVMNPKTGAILALGSTNLFDPNEFNDVKDHSLFTNILVQNVYEMGSIFKPITVAAGINEGKVTADTIYHDTGSIKLNTKTISNHDKKSHGDVNIQYALANSLNVGMAFIVQSIGYATFEKYLSLFGVDSKTGIDLPNEAKPLVGNLKNNRGVEFVTASFGQGVAVSPISITRSIATIANGGYMVTPHVVSKVDYRIGTDYVTDTKKGKQIIATSTAQEVTRMLVQSFDETLLGGIYKMKNHSIAAKTGTAQIAESGSYSKTRVTHTFIGYFPAHDPQFIVFLMSREPKGSRYSSETMTPTFMDLAKFILTYYEIAPDR